MIKLKISSVKNTEEFGVSHNAKIRKHVLIGNDEVANVTNFSEAVFPPGEVAGAHCHSDMVEVFYIKSGKGVIVVDGKSIDLEEGMCVTVEVNETHELKNTGVANLTVMYFGIIVR